MSFRPIRDLIAARAAPVAGGAATTSQASQAPGRACLRLPRSFLLAALVLALPSLLAACAPGPETDADADPDATQAAAATEGESLTVRGQIRLPAGASLPAGAQIEVTLVNTLLADTPMAVLARQTLERPTGASSDFALEVPAVMVEEQMVHALSALARDRDGRVLFVTDSAQRVDPALDTRWQLSLVSVAGPDDEDAGTAAIHLDYDCAGRAVHAIYASDRITLSFQDTGQSLLLPAAIAASGARFALDGNEFWSRGNQASLTLAGQRRVTCHELARRSGPEDTADSEPQ